jgi:patatin-like phospholipase/acyl hydrolase
MIVHKTIRICREAFLIYCSVVLAITKANVDAPPTLFKTYDTSASLSNCTIWQVARATSAATTFFKPIKAGRDEIEFIDAAFGYNNPCEVLIEEARRQFPDHGQMRVLSIGTGLGDVVTINDTRFSILHALKKMATSSKSVAARLDSRYGDEGQYCRLNVDQGLNDITLSDWDKASKISAHTSNYLTEKERAIKKFVENFIGVDQSGNETARSSSPGATGEMVDQGRTRSQEASPAIAEVSGTSIGWCREHLVHAIRLRLTE